MKFTSYIQYAADPETIAAHRASHRAYLQGLFAEGTLVLAGPFTDGSGAMLVHEAASLQQVRQLVEGDPFFAAGLFERIDTRPWKALFANAEAVSQREPA